MDVFLVMLFCKQNKCGFVNLLHNIIKLINFTATKNIHSKKTVVF
ncbi:hypothetical protein JCM19301_3828 [Jejuia pallidilutea]|uniref:Uncharacterized protein n=1 Tax=Jejuia pallidilutea TaxID=504487 RepID=A0A090VMX6_9FLAO|nr:hypothetical protein JCM19301_3828 [Jejuia pallidilutea]GAL69432.1 hypothetical protein JCM19302_4161 [Jejuia pallidilutea]